jgi:type I restriction enzyme M protein
MDLVSPALIVARYFAKEQAAVEALQAKQETAAQAVEEFVEEHSGEEGALAEAMNDKGKVTKGGVKHRLKAIDGEAESDEERDVLERCLALIEAESEASKAVKEALAALDETVLARYGKLTEAEIKTLVVEDKWLASLRAAIDGEVQLVTQQLAGRVTELGERYARPLPELERDVEALSAQVEGHLKMMGLVWG